MNYHLAKVLHDKHGWKSARISKALELNKEKVRGWVSKNRGSPIAKCIKNETLIKEALLPYLDDEVDKGENAEVEMLIEEPSVEPIDHISTDLNHELEDEILYHLSYFPSGISSPRAIKAILIENKDADLDEIQKVLNNSTGILRKNGKWFLADLEITESEKINITE
jgi:hypothetical protein